MSAAFSTAAMAAAEVDAPSDIRPSSDKIPEDFTEEQKAAIRAEIALRSEGLVGVNHGSHQAAAEALHNSTLPAYFDELGIEGWAVIDESGTITSVGTGFHGGLAVGVYARGSRGTWVGSGKSFVWHTHPSHKAVHIGDVISVVQSGGGGIYASGDQLTYAPAVLDKNVIGLETFTVKGFDGQARTINNFRRYEGLVQWELHTISNGNVTITPQKDIKGAPY